MREQVTLTGLQSRSLKLAGACLRRAAEATNPKEAADWSLAAKNSMSAAADSERIMRIRSSR